MQKINLLAENFAKFHDAGTCGVHFSNFIRTEISSLDNNSPLLNFNKEFTADGEMLFDRNIVSNKIENYKHLTNSDIHVTPIIKYQEEFG